MFDFYQKRKLRTIINSPFTQGVILVMVLFVGWSAYIRYEIAVEMTERSEKAKQDVQALEEHKEKLSEQVKYLSNERGIEAEMRRQFDVALEGEQVVVIVDKEKEESLVQPLSTTTEPVAKKWYQFWQ
ncbi:septum formation initiator family protein [Candidatus Nomurabacteria bacterium]|nr:septum formation initiator family protein [Candidatus Nomurabacteria bacterium]